MVMVSTMSPATRQAAGWGRILGATTLERLGLYSASMVDAEWEPPLPMVEVE
jgi:hypothetical protein